MRNIFSCKLLLFTTNFLEVYNKPEPAIAKMHLPLKTKNKIPGILLLQSTQKQLIQSKKKASLEEVIAEAAHEVQKHLNFVSVFSNTCIELSKESLPGMPEGSEEANLLPTPFMQNQKTIATWQIKGKGIVKSILQYSLRISVTKSPTPINLPVNECLRLACRELKASNKDLSAGNAIEVASQEKDMFY